MGNKLKNKIILLIICLIINLKLVTSSNSLKKLNSNEEEEEEVPVGYIPLNFKISSGLLLAPVSIGNPEQEMNLVIDIGSMRTWVSNEHFDKSKSDTYVDKEETDTKKQYDFSYSGKTSTETFKLGDKILEEFKFVLVNSIENTNFNGALSLGHEYDSKHESLVYEMSHVSNTFYNMFMFKFGENDEGQLLIGDMTEEQKRKYHYINKCLFLKGGSADEQIKWRCKLTQMFLGSIEDFPTFRDNMMEQTGYYVKKTEMNKLIDVGKPVVFETIFNKIYVPREAMEYIKENYLKNIVDGAELCNYNDNENMITVTCTQDEVSKLKRLNFVLSEKTALAFPSQKLFDCNINGRCQFYIEYNSKYEGYIFGLPVFKLYDITFDYNARDLIFYSKDNKYLVKIPIDIGTSILTIIIYILIVLIIFMLLALAVIYFMRSKNKKRQEIEEQIYENF